MDDEGFVKLGSALRAQAQALFQRRALVVCGDGDWSLAAVRSVLAGAVLSEVLVVGRMAWGDVERVEPSRSKLLLGREVDAVVLDARAQFDADHFGAISGIVRGGGLLVLLLPALPSMEEGPSHFLRRVLAKAQSAPGVVVLHDAAAAALSLDMQLPPASAPSVVDMADQERAVAAVMNVAVGHRRRPVVLLADRGRGKSAALGMAAAALIGQGKSRIVITAPRPHAVESCFKHLRRALGLVETAANTRIVTQESAECRFVPPDELLRQPREADLLLVDEAAGIPVAVLSRLLTIYPRIAFATTVHGYEGSGRGFVLHFSRVLDRQTPQWHAETLSTPVRWATDDPVEAWINDTLVLNADYAPITHSSKGAAIGRIDRALLGGQEQRLRELVGLLVQAHYRTTPDDVRFLLDDAGAGVWTAEDDEGRVVGALLSADEGPLERELALQVRQGFRRLRGELLPQSLLFHCGMLRAGSLSFRRIVRIAVHPLRQRQGVGRSLLSRCVEQAAVDGIDVVGASFAADEYTIGFWLACGFRPVRLGIAPDHASGLRSLMVLRGVSEVGAELAAAAHQRFTDTLWMGLCEQWRDVPPSVVMQVLAHEDAPALVLGQDEFQRMRAFANARGHYDACAPELWRLCRSALVRAVAGGSVGDAERDALVSKVLQKHTWSAVAKLLTVSGKREAEQRVRQAVAALLNACEG